MNYFTSNKISPSVTEIIDLCQVRVFLIEGKKRALVIDTGTGIGNLKTYISGITSLPYFVVCSHGHGDHTGGAVDFEEVYLNKNDFDLEKRHNIVKTKKDYAKLMLGNRYGELKDTDFRAGREKGYVPLEDNRLFDLGGLTVRAISLPGHTKGSMCFLIENERTMIFGDACNTEVFLFDNDASTVEQYKANLEKFQEWEGAYDKVYLSHGPAEQPKTILTDCIEVCDEIMAGKDDKIPYEFMGMKSILAKRSCNKRRNDGKYGNIVYNPFRIRNI